MVILTMSIWAYDVCRYHSLHHSDQNANFCLFMPLYDYLGGTVHPKTESLYKDLRKGVGFYCSRLPDSLSQPSRSKTTKRCKVCIKNLDNDVNVFPQLFTITNI